jgi:hypothetical protein
VWEGQKQALRAKLAGSTERLGYWGLKLSVAVVVAVTNVGRRRSVPWADWEAGHDEDVGTSWTSGSGSETRSTSMITGDALSKIDVCVARGVGLRGDSSKLELDGSAGTFVATRDDLKKESMLG